MKIELSIPLTISEILSVTGATGYYKNKKITNIVTDSRESGTNSLFFALQGEKASGEDFIREAIRLGAYGVSSRVDGERIIKVKNVEDSLLALASFYKSKLKNLTHTIAISGSVGKTTTKDILADILSRTHKVHKTCENYNNAIGVAHTLLSAPSDTEMLVVEMGMNHFGEIARLSSAANPSIAVITNIGTSHIGNLGSREGIARAKLEIREGLTGSLIVPYEEPLLIRDGDLTFSCDNIDADIYLRECRENEGGYVFRGYKNGSITSFELHTDARHIAKCTAAALCAADAAGVFLRDIYQYFSKSNINSRQKVKRVKNFYFLADFYNASLESFISGFQYALSLREYSKKSALIGDVLELGRDSERIHYEIGVHASEYAFERLYIFGKYSRCVLAGAVAGGFAIENIFINENVDAPKITASQIESTVTDSEIIYAKASHKLNLQRIIDLLSQ